MLLLYGSSPELWEGGGKEEGKTMGPLVRVLGGYLGDSQKSRLLLWVLGQLNITYPLRISW